MSDETWIRELAEASRAEEAAEREELDERWSLLSRPDLSEKEQAELRALAETSPEALEAYEVFRPLGGEFQQQILRRVREVREPIAPPIPVPPIPPVPVPWWKVLFAQIPVPVRWSALGAAASVVVAILISRIPDRFSPALPGYDLKLSGGVVAERGDPGSPRSGVRTFRQDGQLEVLLVPTSTVRSEIAADCYLVHGGLLRSCKASLSQMGQGVIRIAGRVSEDLHMVPGDWSLCAAVGWPHELPKIQEQCTEVGWSTRAGKHWKAWKMPFRVE